MGLGLGTENPRSVNSRDTKPPLLDARTVQLPLDHFGSDAGTFPNRYWVYSENYKPGGPVFILDQGESNAEPVSRWIPDPRFFFNQIVKEFNGIGIAWEHRMYGESVPAGFHNDTSLDRFKYLNVPQALADIDAFAKQFSLPYINATLDADHTPWVFIGASYSGGRAAWVRNKYPDSIYASWASSAVVEAMVDMGYYADAIWAGMNAKGFGNCTRDIQAAIRYADHIMDTDPQAAAKLKEQFLGANNANISNVDFGGTLQVVFGDWQTYAMDGYSVSLRQFCDELETDPKTNQTAPKEGWAPTRGAKSVLDKWALYPGYLNVELLDSNAPCAKNGTVSRNCSSNAQPVDPNVLSWRWQACTQWGYFQPANLGPYQLISKFNTLKLENDQCHQLFNNPPPSVFPEWPKVQEFNQEMGGWQIRPSNTYWSSGEFDPWRPTGPLSQRPDAPKVEITQEIPKCGVSTGKDKLFGKVVEGGVHASDFNTPGLGYNIIPDSVNSRDLFIEALKEWLPCFRPKSKAAKPFKA
ncbi:hypothetical protein COCC4DRAFT_183081 [Bipolaris maydis ATCC 48331]|uniref:Serine peptidase n=2 Tax=Cochliobolus heterostrophus TaxID=5016 RepID=N4XP78_COCH4|nr:uncharacterized protein COCC4DRAFT_183081 [Bipolaris maydis ATCC 48331]ENI10418.1 hypothetical protein COCC4DRAFT_183081 [Bipolaris maydis ATCC 48331]KAJ5030309.1 serine carboxypeptidase S28-domain-containing protein [Bipolaris maydis]KAJ6274850.1 serine carboxypeptidase S28-domain-containing protein [Bipolaris maydis]KAJ6285866.1 serine carboxypeptidase S28-domain-containing protein [Bipolaris maydis]